MKFKWNSSRRLSIQRIIVVWMVFLLTQLQTRQSKKQHGSRRDLSLQMWAKMIDNPKSIHVTESNTLKMKVGAKWLDVPFSGKILYSAKLTYNRNKPGRGYCPSRFGQLKQQIKLRCLAVSPKLSTWWWSRQQGSERSLKARFEVIETSPCVTHRSP